MSCGYVPPYQITDRIIHLVSRISEQVGIVTVKNKGIINPHLRKDNQIRTIHSSLAIENNSLSLEQVTDVINGKRILGVPSDIREVKNAYEAYNLLLSFDPFSVEDLLKAHKILMFDLAKTAGRFRPGDVGVFNEERVVHIAPPADLVPGQIKNLLKWVKDADVHLLIRSCVFHYEFEFIHPFADGNGRMGRMWQTLLLSRWKSVFNWLPVETLIKEHQEEYYKVLGDADKAGDSTVFIEFMLGMIQDALDELIQTEQVAEQATEQVGRLISALGKETLSAKEILGRLELKHRPTLINNYLRPALKLGLIEMTVPDKPNSSKQKYRIIL